MEASQSARACVGAFWRGDLLYPTCFHSQELFHSLLLTILISTGLVNINKLPYYIIPLSLQICAHKYSACVCGVVLGKAEEDLLAVGRLVLEHPSACFPTLFHWDRQWGDRAADVKKWEAWSGLLPAASMKGSDMFCDLSFIGCLRFSFSRVECSHCKCC